MDAELELESLAENVGTGVPERLTSLGVGELEKLDLTVSLQRARRVIIHPALADIALLLLGVLQIAVQSGDATLRVAHLGDDNFLCELARDHLRDVERGRLKGSALLLVSVGQGDRDWLLGHGGVALDLAGQEAVEKGVPLYEESGLLLELPVAADELDLFPSVFVASGQLGALAFLASVSGRRCLRHFRGLFLDFCHNASGLQLKFIASWNAPPI